MSDDAELSYIKVDGNIVEKSDDGEYHVKVISAKDSVNIEAMANDILSKVGINENGTDNKVIKQESLTGDITVFNIIVTAEDGTEKHIN